MANPNFMDLALLEAAEAGRRGEVPVGCVIAREGAVVARAGNRTLADHDPTAHAELIALRAAAHGLGTERLIDCDLYVTLEPCTMCAAAISFARTCSSTRCTKTRRTSPCGCSTTRAPIDGYCRAGSAPLRTRPILSRIT